MAQPSKQDIEYIINHVVLPPKLPQEAEDSKTVATAEQALLSLVLSTAHRFCQQCTSEFKSIWQVVTGMLSRWISLQPHGPPLKMALVSALLEMKTGDVLPIQIRAQNAALIFRRHETQMITECFELSPRAEDVLGCKGNLRRSFPAHGVAIPVEVFTAPAFHSYLYDKIIEMDSEIVDEMMPKSRKAGSNWSEIRDTCHPGLITEWLMATLAAVGSPHKVIQIQKRIRDDVLWDNCLLPWRRSALWLLTRVAIQTTLTTSLERDTSVYQYKSFMVYLIAEILGFANALGIRGDICQIIQMKIARRTAHLDQLYPFVLDSVQRASGVAAQASLECWSRVQGQDADRRATVNLATLKEDTNLTLCNARPALNTALEGVNQEYRPKTPFPSVTHEWLKNTDSNVHVVDSTLLSRSERIYTLAAFEQWVWQTLPVWLEHALEQPDPTACTAIACSASDYSAMALELYEECPEQLSLMLLALGELWRALDIMAGTLIPLLLQYPPEVPNKIFQPLLLPKSCQMRRLQKLELYIDMRHQNVKPGSTGIFNNPELGDHTCFASRFFEISSSHQALRHRIVEEANDRWNAKTTEWEQKNQQRKMLKEVAESIDSCTMYVDAYGVEKHYQGCRKCQLNKQIQKMKIDIFEWPLPKDEVHCRLAVVELQCPDVITAWRNLTWMIVNDLGRRQSRSSDGPKDTLHAYSGLRSHHYETTKSRLVLGSITKSVTVSHYRQSGFPVDLGDLRSDHALQWRFYDSQGRSWVDDQIEEPSFSRICQISLPEGPYKNLEDTVNSTSHTQNDILAAQTDCSAQLSLHEYIAFGSLRADGELTQWFNIWRELTAPNLTWNTESVCCLIQQTAWQSGPSAVSFLRLAHSVFAIAGFSTTLQSNLSRLLDSIRANRKCLYTMNIIIVLTARIFALGNPDTAASATALLQRCRSIIRDWTSGLQTSLRVTTAVRQIKDIQCSLLRAGLLAKATFDIDERYLAQSIVTTEDLECWTTNSIIVYNNTPGVEAELPADLRRLLVQDRKVSYTIYERVRHLCTCAPITGLDNAVLQIWSSFRSVESSWKCLERPHQRWIRKMTVLGLDDRSQTVCYNLLDGGLLIDGSPLGTLPQEYTAHAVFVRVFGDQILQVVTSDMAGMVYMTAAEEHGYIFHFTLTQSRLIIRAKKSSTIYELIPHTAFEGDLPTRLVYNYIHWLNIALSEVEFRPLGREWTTESWHWRLVYRPHAESQLYSKGAIMINPQSQTSQRFFAVLGSLEMLDFMHITWSFGDRVEVELPRFGLRFYLNNDNELECPKLRKIVDPDQSMGTLIGLRNRLVLCARGGQSRKIDRSILIPQGLVSVTRESEHVVVEIVLEGAHVQYMQYQHNSVLSRLDGDGSFMSRVYLAYLHALTTHLLPDPLIGLTGTEQSLKILEEQLLKCCTPLQPAEVDLLNLVAGLTPQRTFYPAHLQVMQQVSWHASLTPLAQHEGFADAAERIVTHSHQFHIFHSLLETSLTLRSRGSLDLLQRAGLRSSAYRKPEYGGNKSSIDHDVVYKGRDTQAQPDKAARVYEMSKYVIEWPERIHVASKLEARWLEWGTVSGFRDGPEPSFTVSELLNLDFASAWAPIYKICQQACRHSSQYQVLFLLSQIAYGSELASLDDLKTLLAFATNSILKDLSPFPDHRSFTLSKGTFPDESQVRSLISDCKEPFAPSRLYLAPAQRHQEEVEYMTISSANINDAVSQYMGQWLCTSLSPIPSSRSKWLSVQAATSAVQHYFEDCYKNRECQAHLAKIQSIFAETALGHVPKYKQAFWHQAESVRRSYTSKHVPTLQSLVRSRVPSFSSPPSPLHVQQVRAEAPDTRTLRLLIDDFGAKSNATQSSMRTQYKTDLLGSLDAYAIQPETVIPGTISETLHQQAVSALKTCETHFLGASDLLSKILGPKSLIERLLHVSGLWPRCRMPDLLQEIRPGSRANLPRRWKTGIIVLGLSISILQRAKRMVLAVEKRDIPGFCKEAENPGRVYWEAEERPDWLLLEIENDLLIRPVQARVALEMIAPSHSSNRLMQLNMGEGKSSVIVPMIAVALADGSQLVRVLVLRSLTRQMQDSLTQRLGGLVGRPIYFMPFSRKTNMEPSVVQRMQTMYHECMTSGGVLLVQPEHVLSFKLMGIERFASDPSTIGAQLLQTQVWLDKYCRNILDESDEILDVKFQLIYTLGSQRSMDGQPDRWVMIQGILDLVKRRTYLLQLSHPKQIEVNQTGAQFPTIQLSPEARRLLISGVLEDICDSKLPGLAMSTLPMEIRQAVAALAGQYAVTDEACDTIKTFFTEDEGYLKKLLLVRGLIAGGVLMHVLFTQRWSVSYGLDPRRCMCAIPYRAKGVPALTAEFGHPDVMIALTCLSYYYGGLTDFQLQSCLELVQKVDDPTLEYDTWVSADLSFPHVLRHWNAVNLEDRQQCDNLLFPALRRNKKVADFFLTRVVFPKEGKDFDQKLSASGWDIPAIPGSSNVTTGFSGTNDNRFLLPSSICQSDLPELQHTSGKVLEIMSRSENRAYYCAMDDAGSPLSSDGLLRFIHRVDPVVRVLIDVGAQILDLSNVQVATRWLEIIADAEAGVYFDEADYAMIVTRTGKREKLASSAYAQQMDRCIVYLDDAHTRAYSQLTGLGTDLKLPRTARAAVTLGPRLTKDRLAQACMRLRQLGQGQTLMFVAPPEVHQDIPKTSSIKQTARLDGLNVIAWSLEQSYQQIQHNQPLRVLQGLNFHRRHEAMDNLIQSLPSMMNCTGLEVREVHTGRLVEYEIRGLRDLYAPAQWRGFEDPDIVTISRTKSDKVIQDLVRIWDQIGLQALQSATMHEEHEREVACEVEQETQIERPLMATPREPTMDSRLPDLIRTGTSSVFKRFRSAYTGIIARSSSAYLFKSQSQPWSLLRVSRGFVKTVKQPKMSPRDEYLRPVNWLLIPKDKSIENVLLISQYEVNQIFDDVQAPTSQVTLICYEPRVTRSMPSLDSTIRAFFPLPGAQEAWMRLSNTLREELHLFAGQLYFADFAAYEDFLKRLEEDNAVPLAFIKHWIGIRRKGGNYLQTHIGQVVSGRLLQMATFDIEDEEARTAG
ncbi:MAG: hypothetical protein Q9178_007344 [Gyalolechia marmorata]